MSGERELDMDIVSFRLFFRTYLKVLYYVRSILLGLFIIIALFGLVLARQEHLSIWNGMYFAFITAFTVGYGDLSPTTPVSKVLCALVLPILGMVLTGIMVAAAMQAIGRLYKAKLENEVQK
ncbi:Ion channel protein [Thermococcus siculi]|uniref:Ion channel protein n=1 Tax=Thermococcus siculi TaxID=72803 RepID=A0A2Z2MMJ5_9EURY|nr:potassium channel family protein [Thermococcus siculi]ASJ08671.1 Ion channel protein [Thermococcus siculi]